MKEMVNENILPEQSEEKLRLLEEVEKASTEGPTKEKEKAEESHVPNFPNGETQPVMTATTTLNPPDVAMTHDTVQTNEKKKEEEEEMDKEENRNKEKDGNDSQSVSMRPTQAGMWAKFETNLDKSHCTPAYLDYLQKVKHREQSRQAVIQEKAVHDKHEIKK
ncbi:hypothetical protein RFI_14785 [Reticulomyxa filosa]|uniref:Uncharacterized protein n=1 Tax=Reticulomyxa filosa TaxID=46433 RepID=X6N9L0_RETFI|nr:hypothetical protein RFI_14785 [Reticulomyxa filosa]|eukprot:ETO22414.1 hypothetical protein RFI_14785 [Reticulomyxa filosa]